MTDRFFTKSGSSPGNSITNPDFVCEYHISLFLLRPLSPAAFDWIEENLPIDRLTWGNATVIEPKMWKHSLAKHCTNWEKNDGHLQTFGWQSSRSLFERNRGGSARPDRAGV